mgnify:CR=1 FL=1
MPLRRMRKLRRLGRRRDPGARPRQTGRTVVAGRSPCRPARNPDILTYPSGPKDSRTRRPRDLRYEWAYIFGAVCPARDVGVALVLPTGNIDMMNRHLAEISASVLPGHHAVLTLDGAGWHQDGGS